MSGIFTQRIERVDSSRPSITRSYGPWAKPHPFLPKEFPLLVCSREETHSRFWPVPTTLKDYKELLLVEKKQVFPWPIDHVVLGAVKILLCMWRKTTVCLNHVLKWRLGYLAYEWTLKYSLIWKEGTTGHVGITMHLALDTPFYCCKKLPHPL